MTDRRLSLLIVVLLVPVALLASATYVVVRVSEQSPDGTSLFIPVPLALAQAAVLFVPEPCQRLDVPELSKHLDQAKSVLAELREASDAELILVRQSDEDVRVAKAGEDLVIEVTTPQEEVLVQFPVEALEAVLASYDADAGCFRLAGVLAAVKSASHAIVQVSDEDSQVSVRLW